MKFCIGIVSYLPKDLKNRPLRIERLNRLLCQINDFWPYADILIIAQNWKDFKPVPVANKIIKYSFEDGIGILKARNTLRTEFLKLDYDYIILFDDDAIISGTRIAAENLVKIMIQKANGFGFVKGGTNAYCPYADSQLNLAVVSRKIFAEVPFPDLDPQKEEGYEDRVFSTLLHNKYADDEFDIPSELKCIHFLNSAEVAKSTWVETRCYDYLFMHWVTTKVEEEIYLTKQLPDLSKYKKLTIADYHHDCDFNNLHFMQLWGDCSNLGYLGRNRSHGPIDNVYSVKPENIKLLLENKYYDHILNYKFTTSDRFPNFDGDSTVEYDFDYVKILHNDPTTAKYKAELKKRIEYFNNFYTDLKEKDNYYFTVNFNDEVVFQKDNSLKGNTLIAIIELLASYNILHKTIFVGLNKGNTTWASNMHLANINDYILKYKLKYVEIYENDIWNTEKSQQQFREQVLHGLQFCSWLTNRTKSDPNKLKFNSKNSSSVQIADGRPGCYLYF